MVLFVILSLMFSMFILMCWLGVILNGVMLLSVMVGDVLKFCCVSDSFRWLCRFRVML